jgi:hypothetical protein
VESLPANPPAGRLLEDKLTTGFRSREQIRVADDGDGTADYGWHPRPAEPVENPRAVSWRRQALQLELYTLLLLLWAKIHDARSAAFTVRFGELRAISVADARIIICGF